MEADNSTLYYVGETSQERAELISQLPTGVHAGKTPDGLICVITITQNETMTVKIHTANGFMRTHYNSVGDAVSYDER